MLFDSADIDIPRPLAVLLRFVEGAEVLPAYILDEWELLARLLVLVIPAALLALFIFFLHDVIDIQQVVFGVSLAIGVL